MFEEPTLIAGDVGVDDRGEVGFVNGFAFDGVKRFYTVRNHRSGFVRAWHGHRREGKYLTVTAGAAVIAAVRIDSWDEPSVALVPGRWVLTATKPSVLYIPPGFANGFMSLTDDTRLMFFSTSTLEESAGDDIRFDARRWNVWDVVAR